MENFIYDYFISPIWDRTGYNVVNTLAYAAIAVAAVVLLHGFLKPRVKFDEWFVAAVLAFVLFGSTIRVVTDAIDGGKFLPVTPLHQLVLESGLWHYGYLTVTPGVYILTAALLLGSFVVLHSMKRLALLPYVGLALWLPHFLLLVPFFEYWVYALPVLLLAAIPTALAWHYLRDRVLTAIVAGQALDGAATFFVIDYFSAISGIQYFEQHVFSAMIGDLGGGFFVFFLVKSAVGLGASYILSREKQEVEIADLFGRKVALDRYYLALILMIIGFAPGIRDVLRMMAGT